MRKKYPAYSVIEAGFGLGLLAFGPAACGSSVTTRTVVRYGSEAERPACDAAVGVRVEPGAHHVHALIAAKRFACGTWEIHAKDGMSLFNPTLLFEVLSPSTRVGAAKLALQSCP